MSPITTCIKSSIHDCDADLHVQHKHHVHFLTSILCEFTFLPFLFQKTCGFGSPVAWQTKETTPPDTPIWSVGIFVNLGAAGTAMTTFWICTIDKQQTITKHQTLIGEWHGSSTLVASNTCTQPSTHSHMLNFQHIHTFNIQSTLIHFSSESDVNGNSLNTDTQHSEDQVINRSVSVVLISH